MNLYVVWSAIVAIALASICSIACNINRIADNMELRESNWAKGYDCGYQDAMCDYEIEESEVDDD